MSTLPPEPTYNANIPIISSAGGTAVAYKDPNSPESIMKKTTLAQAQSKVDTKFDVNLAAVEGFQVYTYTDVYILYVFVTLLLITLFTQTTKLRKLFILSLASLLLVLSIYLLQRNVRL
jgi:hypothetical protein